MNSEKENQKLSQKPITEFKESKIFVIYIGIAGIRSEDIESYVKKITDKIVPHVENSQIITIPTQSYETKMVCINPKYITNEKLIKEHELLMEDLINVLKYEVENLKNDGEKN